MSDPYVRKTSEVHVAMRSSSQIAVVSEIHDGETLLLSEGSIITKISKIVLAKM